jgi:YgiT-type zinc finger domain-containing protein
MECLYCQGKLVKKKVSYTANRHGYHLIIDNVPAWVCEQCGEPMFDEETVETIQVMLGEMDSHLDRLNALAAAAA